VFGEGVLLVYEMKEDIDLADFNYFLTITPYLDRTALDHITLAARWD